MHCRRLSRAAPVFGSHSKSRASLGAFVTGYFESTIFKLSFAAILVASSIYLILKPSEGPENPRRGGYARRLVDFTGKPYSYSVNLRLGFLISLAVGFVSSVFGVGGGIVHVPAMIFLLGMPVHVSTATSFFILTFSSLIGSATHGDLGNVNLEFAALIGLGAVLGAQLGAAISHRTRGTIIERFPGPALIVVAIQLVTKVS